MRLRAKGATLVVKQKGKAAILMLGSSYLLYLAIKCEMTFLKNVKKLLVSLIQRLGTGHTIIARIAGDKQLKR